MPRRALATLVVAAMFGGGSVMSASAAPAPIPMPPPDGLTSPVTPPGPPDTFPGPRQPSSGGGQFCRIFHWFCD